MPIGTQLKGTLSLDPYSCQSGTLIASQLVNDGIEVVRPWWQPEAEGSRIEAEPFSGSVAIGPDYETARARLVAVIPPITASGLSRQRPSKIATVNKWVHTEQGCVQKEREREKERVCIYLNIYISHNSGT